MEAEADLALFDDESLEALAVESAVNDAVMEINDRINSLSDIERTFMLSGPMQLTVKKATGGFAKASHVGGEEFKLTGAYIGKRRALIYQFTPVAAAGYQLMELNETEAKRALAQFNKWSNGNGFQRLIRDAKKAMAVEQDKEANGDKAAQYGEEWGAFA